MTLGGHSLNRPRQRLRFRQCLTNESLAQTSGSTSHYRMRNPRPDRRELDGESARRGLRRSVRRLRQYRQSGEE